MSLEKAIAHGKEHRKPLRGSARFDYSCRPHGNGASRPCPYCTASRLLYQRKFRETVSINLDENSA